LIDSSSIFLRTILCSSQRTPDEAKEVLDEMIDAGWYCSKSFYSKILDKLDRLQ
jgi:pentatricopeptide repeat protein